MRNCDVVRPNYTIKAYALTGIYRVIKFKTSDGIYISFEPKEENKENLNKLDNNISRAKSEILQLALCNHWDYFATLTLNPNLYDRNDLAKFKKDLSQWIRDQSKKLKSKIWYLLIPELHKDGTWHMHGMFSGIPDTEIEKFKQGRHPQKLIKAGFINWPAYSNKFGFVSLGIIRDDVATAFYLTKYMSKDLVGQSEDLGKHLYFASQKLKRAENLGAVYGPCGDLDRYLTYHGDFCSTGMVKNEDWVFPLKHDNGTKIEEMEVPDYDTVTNIKMPTDILPLANTSKMGAREIAEVQMSAFDYIRPEDILKLY